AEIRGYLDGTLAHGPKTVVAENHASEPLVISVTPNMGPATGGTTITITGTHFNKATEVVFGAAGHANFTIVNDKTIVGIAQPSTKWGGLGFILDPAGYVTDVTVVSGQIASPSIQADQFTYTTVLPVVTALTPSSGPLGTVITVAGFNFAGTLDVSFWGPVGPAAVNIESHGFAMIDDHTMVVNSPAVTYFGAYYVLVLNAYGLNFNPYGFANPPGAADTFFFTPPPPPPTVTSVSPNSGPVTGGTTVTITGSGFATASSVSIGGN